MSASGVSPPVAGSRRQQNSSVRGIWCRRYDSCGQNRTKDTQAEQGTATCARKWI
jgi:hypothetical protein